MGFNLKHNNSSETFESISLNLKTLDVVSSTTDSFTYSNGIINTTSEVDAIRFSPHQGNFSGNITLYGVTA